MNLLFKNYSKNNHVLGRCGNVTSPERLPNAFYFCTHLVNQWPHLCRDHALSSPAPGVLGGAAEVREGHRFLFLCLFICLCFFVCVWWAWMPIYLGRGCRTFVRTLKGAPRPQPSYPVLAACWGSEKGKGSFSWGASQAGGRLQGCSMGPENSILGGPPSIF